LARKRCGDKSDAVPLNARWRVTRTGWFVLVCSGLLVADFVVGVFFYGRCVDADESCSTANEWIDAVTLSIAVLLIILVLIGAGVELFLRYRSPSRRRGAP
jgi:hypothetical protein